MFCLYCGTNLPDDAVFCNKCGRQQNTAENKPAPGVALLSFPPETETSIDGGQSSMGNMPMIQETPSISDRSSGQSLAHSDTNIIPSAPSASTQYPEHEMESHANPSYTVPTRPIHGESSTFPAHGPYAEDQHIPPDEFKHADKLSRRTLLTGLVGITGIVVVSGSIIWLARSRTAQITSSSVSSRLSPTPAPAATVTLMYSTDLSAWNINYDRPSSVELSNTPPSSNWIQPPPNPAALRRLFGILNFTNSMQVGVVADETAVLEGGSNMNYIQMQAFLDFTGDMNFSNISPVTTNGSGTQPLEFNINYSNRTQQKYAISVYTYVSHSNGSDTYSLSYYRTCVHHGIARLNGVDYPLAITDEDNDGDYSNLDNVDVTLDLNGNGSFEDDEHFPASKPFTLNGISYVITSITPDGTNMTIAKSHT